MEIQTVLPCGRNTAKQCRLGLFQDSDFAGDLEDSSGIAERAVRSIKDWTSAVLLQSGVDNEWRADPMDCYCFLRNVQDLFF